MKNLKLLLILFILSVFSANAQRLYSNENLKNASTEELNVYLKNAQKQKSSGLIYGGVGLGSTIGTVIYLSEGDSGYGGFFLGLLGIGVGLTTTGLGIGKFISGSSKVNRINNIMEARETVVKFDLSPDFNYDRISGTRSTGMRLSLQF